MRRVQGIPFPVIGVFLLLIGVVTIYYADQYYARACITIYCARIQIIILIMIFRPLNKRMKTWILEKISIR
jgi:hypothetical protein